MTKPMEDKQIVFVVGAGSSTEFANEGLFPIGPSLATEIRTALSSATSQISRGVESRGRLATALAASQNTAELVQAANKVAETIIAHGSIDDLLNEWFDRPLMAKAAKMAIADIIADAEEKSYLAGIDYENAASVHRALDKIRETWLGEFLWQLHPETPRRNLLKALKHVAFIVFNYDRMVEKAIYHWLVAVSDLSPSDAAAAMNELTIIHPHGHLGDLSLSRKDDGFGKVRNVEKSARAIRTYSEECGNKDELIYIQRLCASAQTLTFLGFSYHPSNMKLLNPGLTNFRGEVFGTTYKMLPRNLRVAGGQLLGARWGTEGSVRFRPEPCKTLLKSLEGSFTDPPAL